MNRYEVYRKAIESKSLKMGLGNQEIRKFTGNIIIIIIVISPVVLLVNIIIAVFAIVAKRPEKSSAFDLRSPKDLSAKFGKNPTAS